MSSYLDRLYETDEERAARLAKPKRKKRAKKKSAPPIQVAPIRDYKPGLGGAVKALKERHKRFQGL